MFQNTREYDFSEGFLQKSRSDDGILVDRFGIFTIFFHCLANYDPEQPSACRLEQFLILISVTFPNDHTLGQIFNE